ncbi:MAG: hypothetical protein JNK07_10645 [Alphaproteobacteria bacterium]|nr:hypothetical protein [Alphaproteobacteria bacterium]
MYKTNGFLDFGSHRGRRRLLDLRAPEDRLPEEGPIELARRSRAVDQWVSAFFSADEDDGRARALRGVIEANRADMAMAGVPVFAHPALPEDFATELKRGSARTSVSELVMRMEPALRQSVALQLLGRGESDAPSGSAADGGRIALLGGGDDGGAPPAASRQTKQPPPLPRQHPDQAERDREAADREVRAKVCQNLRSEYKSARESAEYWEREKKVPKFRLDVANANIAKWKNALAQAEADLREAQSRSTEPEEASWICPSDVGEKYRRLRPREQLKNVILDGLCEVAGPFISEDAERRWRRRLEDQKARDINSATAKIERIKREIAKIEGGVGVDQKNYDHAAEGARVMYAALHRITTDFVANGCGSERDLWGHSWP